MKNRCLPVILMVLLCLSATARADTERWHSRGGPDKRFSAHEGWRHHGGSHHYRGDWGWSPLAAAALLGSTVYIANTLANPPVNTVIVSPQVVQYSPPRVAYFCPTSQQYYPVVPTCAMPWQLVSY